MDENGMGGGGRNPAVLHLLPIMKTKISVLVCTHVTFGKFALSL